MSVHGEDLTSWCSSSTLQMEALTPEQRRERANSAALTVCAITKDAKVAREVLECLGALDDVRAYRVGSIAA